MLDDILSPSVGLGAQQLLFVNSLDQEFDCRGTTESALQKSSFLQAQVWESLLLHSSILYSRITRTRERDREVILVYKRERSYQRVELPQLTALVVSLSC